ncbi:MAG: hypothetical protein RMK29_14385 [Myxococcales bacterium]|nr:hypothetical protein [Myxococcota bacterium]MDW8282899.1 hypothetical protein [Myxococcales bacterium]
MAKTTCPLTRAEFKEKAEPISIDVGGTRMVAEPKEFATGSFGWYVSGKATLLVDGKPVQVQVGANLTIIGSKEAA